MPNPWIEHVRAYAKEHNMTYTQALSAAKDSYTKTTKPQKPTSKGGAIMPHRKPGKFPPKSRKVLERAGPLKILSLRIERAPILTFLRKITFGKWDRVLGKKKYDDMFHLSLVINNKYVLEKNQVLNFKIYKPRPQTQQVDVPLPEGFNLTINELLENTRKKMGDKAFSSYDVVKNNCQKFVSSVLTANGLMNPELDKFINQDVKSIVDEFPGSYGFIRAITDLAARINRLVEGEGMLAKQDLRPLMVELDDLICSLNGNKLDCVPDMEEED